MGAKLSDTDWVQSKIAGGVGAGREACAVSKELGHAGGT